MRSPQRSRSSALSWSLTRGTRPTASSAPESATGVFRCASRRSRHPVELQPRITQLGGSRRCLLGRHAARSSSSPPATSPCRSEEPTVSARAASSDSVTPETTGWRRSCLGSCARSRCACWNTSRNNKNAKLTRVSSNNAGQRLWRTPRSAPPGPTAQTYSRSVPDPGESGGTQPPTSMRSNGISRGAPSKNELRQSSGSSGRDGISHAPTPCATCMPYLSRPPSRRSSWPPTSRTGSVPSDVSRRNRCAALDQASRSSAVNSDELRR